MNTSELITDDANAWLIESNPLEALSDKSDRDDWRQTQTYMLARLERFTLVFPSAIIADIVIISQSQVLALPFYDSACLGAIHYNAQIVPLVSLRRILGMPMTGVSRSNLTVVRLSDAVGDLGGLGLVVDAVFGSRSPGQLPPDLFVSNAPINSSDGAPAMLLFRPEILNSQLWQPQRWRKAKSN